MNQPNLDNLSAMLVRDVTQRDRKLSIICIPVGVVQGMDGDIMAVLMSLTLMQDHADNPVSGLVDMDAVFREGYVDTGGKIQQSLLVH